MDPLVRMRITMRHIVFMICEFCVFVDINKRYSLPIYSCCKTLLSAFSKIEKAPGMGLKWLLLSI